MNQFYLEDFKTIESLIRSPKFATNSLSKGRGAVNFALDEKNSLSENDLINQFIAFKLSAKKDGPAIFESSDVTSTIKVSSDEPYMIVSLEMQSFHIVGDVNVT